MPVLTLPYVLPFTIGESAVSQPGVTARTFVVAPDERSYRVAPDIRTLVLPDDNRVLILSGVQL